MSALTPASVHSALSETLLNAEHRVAVDQSWEDCFASLREYGSQLPQEFADTSKRERLGSNIFRIPFSKDLGVFAVKFRAETAIGFMTNYPLFDRTHVLTVPDDPSLQPTYKTTVVDCDYQCVPIDADLKFKDVEKMMYCPDSTNINRRQRTADAIGHMLYALSPDNGADGKEKINLSPGRIITPMPPDPEAVERCYNFALKIMASL